MIHQAPIIDWNKIISVYPSLCSHANKETFGIGQFTTPSLAELRDNVTKLNNVSAVLPRPTLKIIPKTSTNQKDVSSFQIDPNMKNSLFQVASQFNCLEFATEKQLPEYGL